MFKALSNHRQRNRAIRELTKLSDRELADLGMARHDISLVVRLGLDEANRSGGTARAPHFVLGLASQG